MKFLNKKTLVWLIGIFVFVIVVSLDLVTKSIFADKSFSVIGDLIWVEYIENSGASFGMLKGYGTLFAIVGIVGVAVCFFCLFSDKVSSSTFLKICIMVLAGGILGNVIDRIAFGYVRDFIYLKFIDFAIFNIADSAICVSAFLLVCFLLFFKKDDEKKTNLKQIRKTNVAEISEAVNNEKVGKVETKPTDDELNKEMDR